jgi:hypothetical protein
VCPQYDHWISVACSQGWALLISAALLPLRCPIMVGNKGEGDPLWTLGAGEGKEEC